LNGKEIVMVKPTMQRMLPVVGGLLYVMLSVLFGSLWYAALSLMMTGMTR
jgi:hypothetical protein